MREGPDIARLAALIGDPARAAMLSALFDRAALTATELAEEAGVAKPTASGHLAKLTEGGLLAQEKQGRHRYFRLADAEVAALLENLMGVAARGAGRRARPGPRDPELRQARVCYDHLAGEAGVRVYDSLRARGLLLDDGDETLTLTEDGAAFCAGLGLDPAALRAQRRPMLRPCLDWSVRRRHLAGGLGAALLERLIDQGWARRRAGTRIVDFSPEGRRAFEKAFPLA